MNPLLVCVVCTHLELLYSGHVVAEHAVLQQGDGVTLTAHFLDLLTSTVTKKEVTSQLELTPPCWVLRSGAEVTCWPGFKRFTHLTPGSLMLCPW